MVVPHVWHISHSYRKQRGNSGGIWTSHHYFGVAWCVLRDRDPIFRLFPLRGLVVHIGDDDSEVDRAAPTSSVCSDDLLADPWCLSGWETGDIIQPRGLSAYTEIIQVVTDTGEDRRVFLSMGVQRWEKSLILPPEELVSIIHWMFHIQNIMYSS